MKEFATWLQELAEDLRDNQWVQENAYITEPEPSEYDVEDATEDFYDHVYWSREEQDWVAPCQRCGEESPIYCDPSEFLMDSHYCGRSERCIP